MRFVPLLTAILAAALAITACGGDGTGPQTGGNSVAIQSGDAQFGVRSATLQEPLQVIVTDAMHKAKSNVQVTWSIVEGSGATISTTTSTTDKHGVATTSLKLGDQLGTYRVQATVQNLIGSPVRFTAKAVDPPVVSTVVPTSVNAGDTVTISGQNFSTTADENIVLFGGFRGKVVSASGTQLRAVVPLCVPTRQLSVQVMLGAVASALLPGLSVTGTTASALQLAVGEGRAFTDPNELACFRLPGTAGLALILIPQNYSQVVGTVTNIEITGLAGSSTSAFASPVNLVPTVDAPSAWEMHLRRSERELTLGPVASLRPSPQMSALATCGSAPKVGDRCDFQVLNKSDKFQTVTAEVKTVSAHAVVLQDIESPAGMQPADFDALASMFEDPIYNTDVTTFGTPSDLDANGKILILLTPVVNALTDKGTAGFIAGFFYGCDLLTRTQCSGSNRAEIFYAMTADPNGQYSDPRSRNTVVVSLPPVLAHEFQHMINFSQRGNSTDALWLSEGMAHLAEDIVGDVFAQRGDINNASLFRQQNINRGNRFLRATTSSSLVAEEDVGTLEQRGAAYLFTKYLQGRFGSGVLAKLTQSTLSSVTNVTTQTGVSWSTLLSDWSVALWADDAPELVGATVKPEYTFPNVNLRTRFVNTDGSFPLQPTAFGFQDFVYRATLPASTESYVRVQAGVTAPNPLNLTFSGLRGGAFAVDAAPQMTILRVK